MATPASIPTRRLTRTIDTFSVWLREQIELDTLHYELLAVVDETMQPARASLWLRPRERIG